MKNNSTPARKAKTTIENIFRYLKWIEEDHIIPARKNELESLLPEYVDKKFDETWTRVRQFITAEIWTPYIMKGENNEKYIN